MRNRRCRRSRASVQRLTVWDFFRTPPPLLQARVPAVSCRPSQPGRVRVVFFLSKMYEFYNEVIKTHSQFFF
jgi:hypothetical protein